MIILTAYSDFTYAQQAIKFQVSDFVVKNDFFLELPRAVKKIIEQCEVDAKNVWAERKRSPFSKAKHAGYVRVKCEILNVMIMRCAKIE